MNTVKSGSQKHYLLLLLAIYVHRDTNMYVYIVLVTSHVLNHINVFGIDYIPRNHYDLYFFQHLIYH